MSLIDRLLVLIKEQKEFDPEYKLHQVEINAEIRKIEDRIKKEFYQKFSTREERAAAWKELVNASYDKSKTKELDFPNVEKKKKDFYDKHKIAIDHRNYIENMKKELSVRGYRLGVIAAICSVIFMYKKPYKVEAIILNILEKAFKKNMVAELIIRLLIYSMPGFMSIVLKKLGELLGVSIATLKLAISKELDKNYKNENLRNSLDYHFYKLCEDKIEDEELQNKRDKITRDRKAFDLGAKIASGSIIVIPSLLYILQQWGYKVEERSIEIVKDLIVKYPRELRNYFKELDPYIPKDLPKSPNRIIRPKTLTPVRYIEDLPRLSKNMKLLDKIRYLQDILLKIPYFKVLKERNLREFLSPKSFIAKLFDLCSSKPERYAYIFIIAIIFLFGMKAIRALYDRLKKKDDEQNKSKN